jgi:hypothetical protein
MYVFIRKGSWWWHLMGHIHNNLIKLGGSLGNVPQKWKKLVIKTRYISRVNKREGFWW